MDPSFPRYWTYSHYIAALDALIRREYPHEGALAEAVAASPAFSRLQPARDPDLDRAAELLRHAWLTEILLVQEYAARAQLFPYALPWSMVQTYYALYPTMQAYCLLTTGSSPTSHRAMLNAIRSHLTTGASRFPAPWQTVLDGDPAVTRGYRLINCPHPHDIERCSPLAHPRDENLWDYFALFLRTTRKREFEERVQNWKKRSKRKRIYAAERAELLEKLQPTTVFDALYRLRRRANYRDVDSFLFSGRLAADNYTDLHKALCDVVYATSAVFEVLIARAASKDWYAAVVADFVDTTRQIETTISEIEDWPATDTVLRRWEVAQDAW